MDYRKCGLLATSLAQLMPMHAVASQGSNIRIHSLHDAHQLSRSLHERAQLRLRALLGPRCRDVPAGSLVVHDVRRFCSAYCFALTTSEDEKHGQLLRLLWMSRPQDLQRARQWSSHLRVQPPGPLEFAHRQLHLLRCLDEPCAEPVGKRPRGLDHKLAVCHKGLYQSADAARQGSSGAGSLCGTACRQIGEEPLEALPRPLFAIAPLVSAGGASGAG
mmetsp:Transcript_19510/g.42689  ORF Transcript_19510/g.42689 Transcript_19510/m.42689 type:complete len:218 (-) Transcript_19510:1104-1757(-)